MSDELVLQLDPPYAGSAVSPTVDITETTTDVTVTITDFRGEHSYSVEKTGAAIADAEAAAAEARQAASDVQGAVDAATQAAQSANTAAGTANTSAQNADAKAALADSKAALANQAATTANQAAQAAEAAKTAANTAAGQATTAAGNATTAAESATTAAGNADAKAALADTAAANADTATQAANTATTAATNAAQAANNAADYAIEAAEDMPKLVNTASGTTPQTVTDAWPAPPKEAVLYGKSVQDGTPTPDNPVPVQVVGGYNLLKFQTASQYTVNSDGTITLNSTGGFNIKFDALPEGKYWLYARIVSGSASGTNLFTIGGITYYAGDLGTSRQTVNSVVPSQIWVSGNSGFTVGTVIEIMLTAKQCTAFAPYGCIGLQTGETVTPIGLQGHTLAGWDVLNVDSAGRVWIDSDTLEITLDGSQNWRRYAGFDSTGQYGYYFAVSPQLHYDANSADILCDALKGVSRNTIMSAGNVCSVTTAGNEISARMQFATVEEVNAYFTSNPAKVYAKLATPQTIELGTITPPPIAPGDTLAIYASLDPEWAIQYEQDPNIVVTALQSSIAPVEGATASANYSVGAYLIHGNQLYRVTSAIATGEAITPGSNCVACTVMGEVIRLTA